MIDFLLLFLLVSLFIVLVNTMFINNMLVFVFNSGVISILCALIYMVTDAVDVAFTEAAVGTGISTALFLLTIHITKAYSVKQNEVYSKYVLSIFKKISYLVIFITMFFIFIESLIYAPIFGNIDNPAHNELYQVYVQESYNTFNVPNIVTMVLGSFRGYDTLGETLVVLIAALGVFLTLKTPQPASALAKKIRIVPPEKMGTLIHPHGEYILTSGLFALFPLLLLYGFYIQFHGDYGPGGGFQAGVAIAAVYVIYVLVYGSEIAEKFISSKILLYLLALGALIYAGTGFLTYFLGGKFLDYYQLGHDFTHSYHYGLFTIELGVGLTVSAAMSLIIGQFYRRIED